MRRCGRLVGGNFGKGLGGEQDRAVTVGLEIYANVVVLSGVVQVLDACRYALDG